jgi:hypothetical protein
MGLISNMVFKLWVWTLKNDEVLKVYKHAGEAGVEIGEAYVFYDTISKKLKVYVI